MRDVERGTASADNQFTAHMFVNVFVVQCAFTVARTHFSRRSILFVWHGCKVIYRFAESVGTSHLCSFHIASKLVGPAGHTQDTPVLAHGYDTESLWNAHDFSTQ